MTITHEQIAESLSEMDITIKAIAYHFKVVIDDGS